MPPDARSFRDALSLCANGVTIVTTQCDGERHGLTVSAFCSVSADPPRVLVCLGNDTDSKPLIERAGCFAVNVLGRGGVALGPRFAKIPPHVGDLFAGVATTTAQSGAPVLDNCVVWLDCQVEARHPAGDHTIFVGAVVALGRGRDGSDPVVYCQRTWRQLDPRPIDP
jgi:flavin reductase (DIM6/NTAB) family NADH-FMN oxidoreductase RutF